MFFDWLKHYIIIEKWIHLQNYAEGKRGVIGWSYLGKVWNQDSRKVALPSNENEFKSNLEVSLTMLSYSYDRFRFWVKFLCSVKNLIRSYLVKKTYGEYAPSDVFFRLLQSMRILRTNFCQSARLSLLFICLPLYSCFLSVSLSFLSLCLLGNLFMKRSSVNSRENFVVSNLG